MLRVEQYCPRAALKMLVISPNNAGEAMTWPRWRKNATTPGPRCKPGTYALRYSRSTHSTARGDVVSNHLGNVRHGTLPAELVQRHIPQHRRSPEEAATTETTATRRFE